MSSKHVDPDLTVLGGADRSGFGLFAISLTAFRVISLHVL